MDTIETQVADSDPARYIPLDGPESPEAARLYQQITRQPAPERPSSGRQAARPRRRIAIGIATGAVAAGLAAGIALATLPGTATRGQAVPQGRGQAPLELAAKVAARQPAGQTPGPGQFLYSKIVLAGVPGSALPGGTATVQAWLTADGHGRYTTRECDPGCSTLTGTIPGPKERGVNPAITPFAVWGFPMVSPESVASLPASPAALLPILTRFATQVFPSYPGNLGIVETAGSFLATAASPAVRAGLYRTVEQLPGVEILGQATDQLGRHGIAVGVTSSGLREEIIYNPSSSAVLETETMVVAPGGVTLPLKPDTVMKKLTPGQRKRSTLTWRHGEVVSTAVYAASGVVNSETGIVPAG